MEELGQHRIHIRGKGKIKRAVQTNTKCMQRRKPVTTSLIDYVPYQHAVKFGDRFFLIKKKIGPKTSIFFCFPSLSQKGATLNHYDDFVFFSRHAVEQ